MVIEAMKLKEEKDLIYSDENETRELGCIGHLRGDFGRSGNDFYKKLMASDTEYIHNVWGIGYRFQECAAQRR